MAVDPVPSLRDTDDVVVEAINYGTGNAGSFLPSAAGVEYRVWNDKGKVKTSSPMTSVLVTTRDSDGLEVLNLVTQNWIEIKSTTIHAGVAGGSIAGYTDDNMPDFQPVGKDNFVVLGNIPYDCYRKILVRMRIPTSGLKAGVTFKIYVTHQQAQSSIANYITTIHGNGVIYQASGAFAVSINGGDASLLDIEKGFSLITNSRVYYGNSQQYDVSALDDGTYKIYLTQAGAVSSIISTSAIPSNSIELTRAVVSGGICTGVTDKRLFLANVMVGLDAAKTATPTKNQVYIATDTEKLYICFADDTWSQVIPDPDMVTKTGDFTAGKLVKINNASGIVEQGTNIDTDVADAVTKKHAQNTDTQFDFYNVLASDHTWSGNKDTQLVGESVVFGDLLYFNWTDKEWKKAKADASATMPGLRIALESKSDGEDCLMLVKGYIRDDDAFDFAGAMVYVSEATAGAMTSTAPSTTGNQLQRVGQAKSADILFFDPSIDVGEI